jgi:hypothetical protein
MWKGVFLAHFYSTEVKGKILTSSKPEVGAGEALVVAKWENLDNPFKV